MRLLAAAVSLALAGAAPRVDPGHLKIADCPHEPGCHALMLLEEIELDNEGSSSVYAVRRMIKLFTQRGIDEYADTQVESSVGDWEVKDLAGRTILPDGSSIPLSRAHIRSKSLASGKRTTKVLSAAFPGVVPGAVVEYSFRIVTPRDRYLTYALWRQQKTIPVLQGSFVLRPGSRPLIWRQAGLEPPAVRQESLPKGATRFVVEKVPGLAGEPDGTRAEALLARRYFLTVEWSRFWLSEVAREQLDKAQVFIQDDPGVADKVAKLTATAVTPADRLRSIYRFIQEKIGTEEMRAGATDRKERKGPSTAGSVLAQGWGDEMERTLLFLSMARAADLQGGLLMIAGRSTSVFDPEMPDPDQFDSYAAAILTGSGWTYYDPATRHCPFGMLSAEKEGGSPNAILVRPGEGVGLSLKSLFTVTRNGEERHLPYTVAAVPVSPSSRNVLTRDVTVRLMEDGGARAQVVERGTGQADLEHRSRYELKDDEERRKALVERIHDMIPTARLISTSFQDIDSFDKLATIAYEIDAPALAAIVRDRMVISAALLGAGRSVPVGPDRRRTPLLLPFTGRAITTVRVTLPDDREVDQVPEPVVINEPPFTLTLAYSVDDRTLSLVRRLEVETARISAEDYPKLRSFFQKVQEADRQGVILKQRRSGT